MYEPLKVAKHFKNQSKAPVVHEIQLTMGIFDTAEGRTMAITLNRRFNIALGNT